MVLILGRGREGIISLVFFEFWGETVDRGFGLFLVEGGIGVTFWYYGIRI